EPGPCQDFGTDPIDPRPRAGRGGRRHRPSLRLESHPAAGAVRARLGAVGGVPGDPGLPGAVAADPGRQRLSQPPPAGPGRALLLGAGIAGTLPNPLLGLCAGAAGMLAGARAAPDRRAWALVFHRWPWGPGGVMTLGNVILHTGEQLD